MNEYLPSTHLPDDEAVIWPVGLVRAEDGTTSFGPAFEGTLETCLDQFRAMPAALRDTFFIEFPADHARMDWPEISGWIGA